MEQAYHNARKEHLWFFCKRERTAKGRRYKLKKKSFVGQPHVVLTARPMSKQQLSCCRAARSGCPDKDLNKGGTRNEENEEGQIILLMKVDSSRLVS